MGNPNTIVIESSQPPAKT